MSRVSQSSWERVVAAGAGVAVVGIIGYLVVRNEKFADPNLVVLMRIILGLSVAVLGATVPGFLNVSWKGSGLGIRAGGALALFVLSLFWTPHVEQAVSPSPINQTTTGPGYPAVANTGGPVILNNNSKKE